MPRRPITPPSKEPHKHYDTVERASVLAVKKAFDDRGILYPIKDLLADQGVKEAPGRGILKSGQARTFHNDPDHEETQGRKNAILEETAQAMEEHIEEAESAEDWALSY